MKPSQILTADLNYPDNLVNQPFARVEYSKAIELLQEEIAKDPSKWQFPDVKFGTGMTCHVCTLVRACVQQVSSSCSRRLQRILLPMATF